MTYAVIAVERAMKIQEVILRAMSGALTWLQAADILGMHPRSSLAVSQGKIDLRPPAAPGCLEDVELQSPPAPGRLLEVDLQAATAPGAERLAEVDLRTLPALPVAQGCHRGHEFQRTSAPGSPGCHDEFDLPTTSAPGELGRPSEYDLQSTCAPLARTART
jgi:hypothetical protein